MKRGEFIKRIEDVPELKSIFDLFFKEWLSSSGYVNQEECEHFFLKGFDVAMATGGLPQRPKRTVKEFYYEDNDVYALSSDGQIYLYLSSLRCWSKLPDLPQD